MENFTFHNPTRILFGRGRIADIRREVPAGARVLITYGGGSVCLLYTSPSPRD